MDAAQKFDEEKRHIIAELTEEKSAHMRTIQDLQAEKKNNEQLLKQIAGLSHVRESFEESQKLMIQTQVYIWNWLLHFIFHNIKFMV